MITIDISVRIDCPAWTAALPDAETRCGRLADRQWFSRLGRKPAIKPIRGKKPHRWESWALLWAVAQATAQQPAMFDRRLRHPFL